jgi:hypothetical protein
MGNALQRYYASSDAVLDPSRCLDRSATIVVIDGDRPKGSMGRAYLVGWLLGGGRPVATYRLTIGGDEVPGLFIRAGRRFELVEA